MMEDQGNKVQVPGQPEETNEARQKEKEFQRKASEKVKGVKRAIAGITELENLASSNLPVDRMNVPPQAIAFVQSSYIGAGNNCQIFATSGINDDPRLQAIVKSFKTALIAYQQQKLAVESARCAVGDIPERPSAVLYKKKASNEHTRKQQCVRGKIIEQKQEILRLAQAEVQVLRQASGHPDAKEKANLTAEELQKCGYFFHLDLEQQCLNGCDQCRSARAFLKWPENQRLMDPSKVTKMKKEELDKLISHYDIKVPEADTTSQVAGPPAADLAKQTPVPNTQAVQRSSDGNTSAPLTSNLKSVPLTQPPLMQLLEERLNRGNNTENANSTAQAALLSTIQDESRRQSFVAKATPVEANPDNALAMLCDYDEAGPSIDGGSLAGNGEPFRSGKEARNLNGNLSSRKRKAEDPAQWPWQSKSPLQELYPLP